MAPACSTWSLKNSPKFFMYILHLVASTTAVVLLSARSLGSHARCTARINVAQLANAGGLDEDAVGVRTWASTCLQRIPQNRPLRLQQMQPEFISVISNAGVLQEAAVHRDLTEFIFN